MSKELEELIALTEDELMLLIGEELKPRGFALDERDDKQKKMDGESWFERNRKRIQDQVCASDMAQNVIADGRTFSRVELAAAIVDAISLVVTGVSPALIAVVVVRRGLVEFCADRP